MPFLQIEICKRIFNLQDLSFQAYVTWFSISNFFVPLIVLIFTHASICVTIWKTLGKSNAAPRITINLPSLQVKKYWIGLRLGDIFQACFLALQPKKQIEFYNSLFTKPLLKMLLQRFTKHFPQKVEHSLPYVLYFETDQRRLKQTYLSIENGQHLQHSSVFFYCVQPWSKVYIICSFPILKGVNCTFLSKRNIALIE